MDGIRQTMANSDAQRLRLTAHTLKGSLRCFGAKTAGELVWKIESLAREGNLAPVPDVLASLEAEIHKVYAALRDYLQTPSTP